MLNIWRLIFWHKIIKLSLRRHGKKYTGAQKRFLTDFTGTTVQQRDHSVEVVINFRMTGDPYQNDQGYQTVSSLLLPRNATRVISNAIPKDPSYPPGMKYKQTGILRSEEITVRPNLFWKRDVYELFPNSKRDYFEEELFAAWRRGAALSLPGISLQRTRLWEIFSILKNLKQFWHICFHNAETILNYLSSLPQLILSHGVSTQRVLSSAALLLFLFSSWQSASYVALPTYSSLLHSNKVKRNSCVVKEAVKKRIFYSQADRKRWPPLTLRSAFPMFFGFVLTPDNKHMCSETDFKQEKVIFLDNHLQEACPSVLSFARCRFVQGIICNHEKGMKNAFLRPITMR